MGLLKIKQSDCSLLGQIILQYMEKQQISMTEVANKVGIGRLGVRNICLKQGNFVKANIHKLSRLLSMPPGKIYYLVCKNKIRNSCKSDRVNFVLRSFDTVIKVLFDLSEKSNRKPKLPDYQLIDEAFKSISFMYKNDNSCINKRIKNKV